MNQVHERISLERNLSLVLGRQVRLEAWTFRGSIPGRSKKRFTGARTSTIRTRRRFSARIRNTWRIVSDRCRTRTSLFWIHGTAAPTITLKRARQKLPGPIPPEAKVRFAAKAQPEGIIQPEAKVRVAAETQPEAITRHETTVPARHGERHRPPVRTRERSRAGARAPIRAPIREQTRAPRRKTARGRTRTRKRADRPGTDRTHMPIGETAQKSAMRARAGAKTRMAGPIAPGAGLKRQERGYSIPDRCRERN